MDKVKRYLGLAATIPLLLAALVPVSAWKADRAASTLTPFGKTYPTAVVLAQQRGEFWLAATQFLEQRDYCRAGNNRACYETTGRDVYAIETYVVQHKHVFNADEPNFDSLLRDYLGTWRTRALLANGRESLAYRIAQIPLATARLEELEPRVVPALKNYAVALRPLLVAQIYTLHALLFLLVVLMIWKRRLVGAAILWPFGALIGTAKQFHKNV